jgi:hypothetical protein
MESMGRGYENDYKQAKRSTHIIQVKHNRISKTFIGLGKIIVLIHDRCPVCAEESAFFYNTMSSSLMIRTFQMSTDVLIGIVHALELMPEMMQ